MGAANGASNSRSDGSAGRASRGRGLTVLQPSPAGPALSAYFAGPYLQGEVHDPQQGRDAGWGCLAYRVTIADLCDLSFQCALLLRDFANIDGEGIGGTLRGLPAAALSPQELRWEGTPHHVYMIVTVATRP
ncbi:hypothetical protein AK812_SmicGene29729 [Symbiodinium microadriaticum]|uniref:Uncharacterized protein n=1 Tax=Symbiodinium microadriaticum TaxID=2951 RepID=A0A1Q9D0Z9_SYMMI|nr:hypothetical protein AK812_SmicGene29729 [Symbiodinium microadriaticum]CAE7316322.1 unnamed protein product [Symbiodinium sp. KB8]CAE7380552.1 unnamed protein product [Symbiodinium microadriaticum]